MIIYYALDDYAEPGYWASPQEGFKQFAVPEQTRKFVVPEQIRRFVVPAR